MLGILLSLKLTFLELLNKYVDLLKTKQILLFLILFCSISTIFGQTARIKGVILDENNQPVRDVSISTVNKNTISDETGFYVLDVPANKKITLIFSHISFKNIIISKTFTTNIFFFN